MEGSSLHLSGVFLALDGAYFSWQLTIMNGVKRAWECLAWILLSSSSLALFSFCTFRNITFPWFIRAWHGSLIAQHGFLHGITLLVWNGTKKLRIESTYRTLGYTQSIEIKRTENTQSFLLLYIVKHLSS